MFFARALRQSRIFTYGGDVLKASFYLLLAAFVPDDLKVKFVFE